MMIYEDPKTILETLVKSLVGEPEKAVIREVKSSSTLILSIRVPVEDRGKIIGRKGNIFKSLETLFMALGAKLGKQIIIDLDETEEGGSL